MSVPDRKEIIRIDCKACSGNGFIRRRELIAPDNPEGQTSCVSCGGVGMREKAMDYRAEGYTIDDAAEIFNDPNPTNKLLAGDPALDRSVPRSDSDS